MTLERRNNVFAGGLSIFESNDILYGDPTFLIKVAVDTLNVANCTLDWPNWIFIYADKN
jgi:hypothetical protein